MVKAWHLRRIFLVLSAAGLTAMFVVATPNAATPGQASAASGATAAAPAAMPAPSAATPVTSLPTATATSASAPAVTIECAKRKELRQLLQARQQQLQSMRDSLAVFISGEKLVDIPPSALFTVDLADEKAVRRRAQELQQRLAGDAAADNALTAGLLECAQPYPEYAEAIGEILQLEGQIARSRLDFLSLPEDRRSSLINAQRAILLHAEKALEMAQERSQAEQQKSEAIKSIEAAEDVAKHAQSADLRDLGAQRAILEKSREQLATVKARMAANLQERATYYKTTAEALSALNAKLNLEESSAKLYQQYKEAAAIWRQLVDHIANRIGDLQHYEIIDTPPEPPAALLERLGTTAEASDYRQAYKEIQQQYEALVALRTTRFDEERDSSFRLLLQASKLRSTLLQGVAERAEYDPLRITQANVDDLYREVRIVPYQWVALFYGKLLDMRQKWHSGLDGIVSIVEQTGVFITVLALPFFIYFVLVKLTEQLNDLRRRLVRRQFDRSTSRISWSGRLALWIQRINPYLPWIITLLGLRIVAQLVSATVLAEVALLLPYIELYVWYRIFINLVATLVGVVAYSVALQQLQAVKERIQHSARVIGLFFFVALVILHATEDAVSHALVYSLVSDMMLYLGTVVCFFGAWQWRDEIGKAVDSLLPQFISGRLGPYCRGRMSLLLSLPALILVAAAVGIEHVRETAGEIDVFKRLGAEIFRRRIESSVAKSTAGQAAERGLDRLPASYLDLFDLDAPSDPLLLIEPGSDYLQAMFDAITAWREGHSPDNSIVLHGDKGSGKSSVLRLIETHNEELQVVKIGIPPKSDAKEALRDLLRQRLQFDPISGIPRHKTLVLVDDAHNMFLARVGGFEAYRDFLEIVSQGSREVFWVVALNRYAWNYLQAVLGTQQYFAAAIAMPAFSETDIQALIKRRHGRSSMRLSYDNIIRAMQTNDEFALEQIEHQFFRLLWGQSKGNPRAAIVLWLSSLIPAQQDVLKVGIPHYNPIRGLELLLDDTLFVFAAILRHENLSLQETITVTNLAPGTVRISLKSGTDMQLVNCSADGRYRITPVAQAVLTQTLAAKNFIHG